MPSRAAIAERDGVMRRVDVASPLPESCKYYAARRYSVPHLCVLLRVIKGIKHTLF